MEEIRDFMIIIGSVVTIVCLLLITIAVGSIDEKLDTTTNCITYNRHRYCMEEVE